MDTKKFKIGVGPILVSSLLFTLLGTAQYYVPVYITTSSFPDQVVKPSIITVSNIDYGYVKVDTAYREAFEGFNYLLAGKNRYPIHLESYDDFNAAAIISSDTTVITYTGAQGAIKNNFLLERNQSFTQFTKQYPTFIKNDVDIESKLDSLTAVWKSKLEEYTFSDIFIQDELMFYKSYKACVSLIAQQQLKGQTLSDLELEDFPPMDYTIGRYYNTLPYYEALSIQYLYQKALSFDRVGQARGFINNLDHWRMSSDLKKMMMGISTEQHPRSKFLFKVAKPLYKPHTSINRRFYRKSKRLEPGASFQFPDGVSIDGSAFDFKSLDGKQVYIFVYDINNPILGNVLTAWNKFYKSNKDEDSVFIAYAVNGFMNESLWKSLQIDGNIAGLSLRGKATNAIDYLEDLGVLLLPRLFQIAPDGTLQNPNVDLNVIKRNVINP